MKKKPITPPLQRIYFVRSAYSLGWGNWLNGKLVLYLGLFASPVRPDNYRDSGGKSDLEIENKIDKSIYN